jgi:2-haloalkanoic acid dehalogenase type II
MRLETRPSMRKSRKVKAVIFDLGGTIVKSFEPAQVFHRILEAHGYRVQIEKIRAAHKRNETEFDVDDMADQGMEYWNRWNGRLLESIGIEDNERLLARSINEQWFNYADLQVYSDAAETLEKLKLKKVKLGIVTNALEEEIRKMFDKLGLNNLFDVAVGCDTCRKAKPRREIFCYALERLNVQAGEAIFVGDSLKYDYEGAEKAGMRAVLVSRNGDAPAGIETVKTLTEILEYVDREQLLRKK